MVFSIFGFDYMRRAGVRPVAAAVRSRMQSTRGDTRLYKRVGTRVSTGTPHGRQCRTGDQRPRGAVVGDRGLRCRKDTAHGESFSRRTLQAGCVILHYDHKTRLDCPIVAQASCLCKQGRQAGSLLHFANSGGFCGRRPQWSVCPLRRADYYHARYISSAW